MILLSSGHGLHVRGASGLIDEVTEARRVVDRVGEIYTSAGIQHRTFHENNARNQTDNVNTIVQWHNSFQSNLCVSVHFNSVGGGIRDAGIGVETLYFEQSQPCRVIASNVSKAISSVSGLILRRGDGTLPSRLGFLRLIRASSILIEVCFVNSRTDVQLYQDSFGAICHAIAESVSGQKIKKVDGGMEMDVNINIDGVLHERVGGIVENRAFIPVRFIAEYLGATVAWDDEARTVTIKSGKAKVTPNTVSSILKEMDIVLARHLLS